MGKIFRAGTFLALTAVLAGTALPVGAVQVDTGAVYCFRQEEFDTVQQQERTLTGVCITGVPDAREGRILLGDRVICAGDILAAGQLDSLTFQAGTGEGEAEVTFLPIYGTHVEQETALTFSVRKKENAAPTAEDSKFETYKNLENKGTLKASDPEGEKLTYNLVTEPKRGSVVLHEDGTFTYTPTKNRVGKDAFTYTVTDASGATSQEATVKVEILKALDSNTYRDVTSGQFEALWMREQGLYTGAQVAGALCFGPEEPVTRGDFLVMVMKLLNIPTDGDLATSGFVDQEQAAQWIRPYLATAMRLGLVSGTQSEYGLVFRPNDPITGAEAAVMLENILLLPTANYGEETATTQAPQWAQEAVAAMADSGVVVSNLSGSLTRMETARLLYAVSQVSHEAPGMTVFHTNP